MKTYIERYPDQTSVNEARKITSLEELKKYWHNGLRCFCVSNFDLSALDFSTKEGQTILKQLKYNLHTLFPQEIHSQMVKQLEKAKDPGLGIQSMHLVGYTGKNITLAIIDQPTLVQHPSYKISRYVEIGWKEYVKKYGFAHAQMHGPAVTNIASSVAPNANIVYLAAHNWDPMPKGSKGHDDTHYCEALQYLLEYNRTLSETDKIRFLSCSWGTSDDLHFDKRMQLFQQLEDEGVMILGGYWGVKKHRRIDGLGRDLMKSTNKTSNYFPLYHPYPSPSIWVPIANKTLASVDGEFEYDPTGGASWSCPYLAGAGACALQANPDFVKQKGWQDRLWQLMLETGAPLSNESNSNRIIQPAKLCEKMHAIYLKSQKTQSRQQGRESR